MQKITYGYISLVLPCVHFSNVPYGASLVINTPSRDSAMQVVLKLMRDLGCDHLRLSVEW